eukprot:Awhi_evm1s6684
MKFSVGLLAITIIGSANAAVKCSTQNTVAGLDGKYSGRFSTEVQCQTSCYDNVSECQAYTWDVKDGHCWNFQVFSGKDAYVYSGYNSGPKRCPTSESSRYVVDDLLTGDSTMKCLSEEKTNEIVGNDRDPWIRIPSVKYCKTDTEKGELFFDCDECYEHFLPYRNDFDRLKIQCPNFGESSHNPEYRFCKAPFSGRSGRAVDCTGCYKKYEKKKSDETSCVRGIDCQALGYRYTNSPEYCCRDGSGKSCTYPYNQPCTEKICCS